MLHTGQVGESAGHSVGVRLVQEETEPEHVPTVRELAERTRAREAEWRAKHGPGR